MKKYLLLITIALFSAISLSSCYYDDNYDDYYGPNPTTNLSYKVDELSDYIGMSRSGIADRMRSWGMRIDEDSRYRMIFSTYDGSMGYVFEFNNYDRIIYSRYSYIRYSASTQLSRYKTWRRDCFNMFYRPYTYGEIDDGDRIYYFENDYYGFLNAYEDMSDYFVSCFEEFSKGSNTAEVDLTFEGSKVKLGVEFFDNTYKKKTSIEKSQEVTTSPFVKNLKGEKRK